MKLSSQKKFDNELAVWLSEDVSISRRIIDAVAFRIRKLGRYKFRWWSLPDHILGVALVASGPAIAYQTSGAMSKSDAMVAFLIIAFFLIVFRSLNGWSKARSRRLSGPLQTIWVRIGDLLNTVKSGATVASARDSSIESTLAIASSIAAEIAQVSSENVSATLVQYIGTGFGKMTVTHRNRGSVRPVRRPIKDISTLLGHHACQHDAAPRVVPDLRRFGQVGMRSPTQSNAQYRSIFLQPLTSSTSHVIRGFISIDCTVPHAFHGRRSDDLVALLEPIKAHIEDII